MKIRTMTRVALFAALTAVGAFIRIPLGYSSITLQTFFTAMAGCVLGPWYGFFAAGIGSALADLISGYAYYVPATFVIKGLVALVAMMPLIVVQVMGAIYVVKTRRNSARESAPVFSNEGVIELWEVA